MKKFLSTLLIVSTTMLFIGCSNKEEKGSTTPQPEPTPEAKATISIDEKNSTDSAIHFFVTTENVASAAWLVTESELVTDEFTAEAILADMGGIAFTESQLNANKVSFSVEEDIIAETAYTIFVAYTDANGAAELTSATYTTPMAPKPEVEMEFILGSISDLLGMDYEATYPASRFLGIQLKIDDPTMITGLRIYFGDTDEVHATIDSGEATAEEIVDTNGSDSYAWIQSLSAGGGISAKEITSGSDICVLIAVDTIYDNTQYYHLHYTMPN